MARILFLVSATAVGKSAVALALAEQTGAAILSMDSMQVYRGLEIGTGQPSASERARVRHGGLGLVDWRASFTVADYLSYATEFFGECAERGQPVIVVGGTGLYFRGLTQGLCEAPPAEPALRQALSGWSVTQLQERLRRCDPEIFGRIDEQNPRRLQRAIEVMEGTGISLRDWQTRQKPPLVTDFQAVWLQREREELRRRIAQRVAGMFAAGWKEEVQARLRESSPAELQSCVAIGYREIAETLANEGDWAAAEQSIVTATRRYAKRQLTWFRRETTLFPLMPAEKISSVVRSLREHWLVS